MNIVYRINNLQDKINNLENIDRIIEGINRCLENKYQIMLVRNGELISLDQVIDSNKAILESIIRNIEKKN